MTRLSVRPLVVALVCGVGSVVIGLRPADAFLIGLLALVVGVVSVAVGAGEDHLWPDSELEETDGTRREISALTWSFIGREGRVAEPAVRRLRVVAARRLARRGVVLPRGLIRRGVGRNPSPAELDDDQRTARELLGERAWTILTAPGGRLPSLADVTHCVTVIEQLGPHQPSERPHP